MCKRSDKACEAGAQRLAVRKAHGATALLLASVRSSGLQCPSCPDATDSAHLLLLLPLFELCDASRELRPRLPRKAQCVGLEALDDLSDEYVDALLEPTLSAPGRKRLA